MTALCKNMLDLDLQQRKLFVYDYLKGDFSLYVLFILHINQL